MWLHAEVKSLADIPRHYARTTPERTALIGGGQRRSFAELDTASNRVANAILRSKIARNSHIGFLGKNSIEYFEVLFGASKTACATLPLNWRLAAAELAAVVDDAQTPLIFVDREFTHLLEQVRTRTQASFRSVVFDSTSRERSPYQEWIGDAPATDPHEHIASRDTALLMYTSGTTGKPKGVELTHGGMGYMRLCEHLEPSYNWQPNDVMMLIMPIFHLVGTGLSVQGLYNGVPITILPALDVPRVLETIARDRPTICCLVPTAIQMLVDHPASATTDFSSLRLVMYAGSPITAKLLKRALTEMKCNFMQFYGATESGGALTLLRPEKHNVEDEVHLKSCGTPLPLIDIRIIGADGKDVADGSIGEFIIRAPCIFKGYWRQPEATAAALVDGWYRTGDAGYRAPDGLLYIVDRTKDMIISGGENIYSTEVEQALIQHPCVSQVAVVGVPDERWGEKVVAAVVLANGKDVSEADLIAHCRTLIAGYKVPKTVRFLDSLPLNPSGKILKTIIRARLAAELPA
jgi:acyl-CoA synthetase (AMP-forming)/AMP-acid ligase II